MKVTDCITLLNFCPNKCMTLIKIRFFSCTERVLGMLSFLNVMWWSYECFAFQWLHAIFNLYAINDEMLKKEQGT